MDKDIAALKKIIEDLNDLGFDYDRMSSSGQETYDSIQTQMEKLAPTLNHALDKTRRIQENLQQRRRSRLQQRRGYSNES